jgi:hypothetical protein
VDAGVVPGLIAVDQNAGAPGLIANVQRAVATFDDERTPAIERQRGVPTVVELALDDDPAFVRDQPSGRYRRAGLPLEGESVAMLERGGRADEPLAVELDRACGAPNQWVVAGQYGKGAGRLIGKRL